jgi:hypothetical protein
MIPEYKLYHGAVLAELVHRSSVPVRIDELYEAGRLSSYILDSFVGLQVKHSTQRLRPWAFTFTRKNVEELVELRAIFPSVFVVLVCHTDGMVCLTLAEFLSALEIGESDQGWLRVDRKRGKWYEVTGAKVEKPLKYPRGIDVLIEALGSPFREVRDDHAMEPETSV